MLSKINRLAGLSEDILIEALVGDELTKKEKIKVAERLLPKFIPKEIHQSGEITINPIDYSRLADRLSEAIQGKAAPELKVVGDSVNIKHFPVGQRKGLLSDIPIDCNVPLP